MAKDDGEVKVPTVPAPQVEVVKDHDNVELPEAVVPDVPALEEESLVADVPEIAEPRTGAVSFDGLETPGGALPLDFGSLDLPSASAIDVPTLESGSVLLNEPESLDLPAADAAFADVDAPENLPIISADDFKEIDQLNAEPPLPVAQSDFAPQNAETDFAAPAFVQFDETPAMGSTGLAFSEPLPPPVPDLSAETLGVPMTITLEAPAASPTPSDLSRRLAELETRIEHKTRFG